MWSWFTSSTWICGNGVFSGKAITMLLHCMQKWPEVVTAEFWPFEFSYTRCVNNNTLGRGKDKTPYEMFTDESPSIKPQDFRVFGCPVYVLSKDMQDGKPTGKFSKRRSYLGVFVGFSDAHSGSVPLVFNPRTKLVSPQYYCVFDECFDTAVSTCDKKDIQEKIFQSLTFLRDE